MNGGSGSSGPSSPSDPGGETAARSAGAPTTPAGDAPAAGASAPRGREGTGERVRPTRDDSGEFKRAERERARRSKPPGGAAAQEPTQMLDLSELPETYGKDEVGILSKDPLWYFVYWEVTDAGEAAAREQLGPSGETARLVLRLFITLFGGYQSSAAAAANGAAPSSGQGYGRETRELRDVQLPHHHGRKYLEAPRPGALLRAAVGLLSDEGYFAPIAHSAPVRMPQQQAAAQASVEWLHVLPARSEGHKRERIVAVPPSAPHQEGLLPVLPGGPASGLVEPTAQLAATADADPGSSTAQVRRTTPAACHDPAAPADPGLGHGSGGLG